MSRRTKQHHDMITVINPPYSTRNLPPLSVLLLLFAALFVVAAWKVSKLDDNKTPQAAPVELSRPSEFSSPAPAPTLSPSRVDPRQKQIGASDLIKSGRAYRAYRHQAVSLGISSASDGTLPHKNGALIGRRAIL